MIKSKLFFISLPSFLIFISWFFLAPTAAHPSGKQSGISAQRAAEYIHAVIKADRTIYSQYIVERLGETVSLKATEQWKNENTLPLPAQFLMVSSKIVNSKNLGIKYRLMSLWPINKNNAARSNQQRAGLKKVAKNPGQPHLWSVKKNGKILFNAVYPDLAVTKSCVHCHNNHPRSPKKDFKRGEVMGGIHISFPISKANNGSSLKDYRVSGGGGGLCACHSRSGPHGLCQAYCQSSAKEKYYLRIRKLVGGKYPVITGAIFTQCFRPDQEYEDWAGLQTDQPLADQPA